MSIGFGKIKRLVGSRQTTIKGAAIILIITVFLSRILGLVRDRLLAGFFGAGVELDSYFAAFRIPDLIFNILFAGGIIVSLLPVFAEYQKKNEKESWKIINTMINFFIVSFIIFSVIFFAFTPQIISSTISSFSPEAQQSTIILSRMIFVSVLFFGISSVLSTILNYYNRFVAYSLAPILYNLGIIFGVVFLAPYWGIYGAGAGVIIGALAHLLVQLPSAIKCGWKYELVLGLNHPAMKNLFTLMLPRAIAASASQINFIVATSVAAGIGAGAISVFYFSNNLRYVPVGIIGISFATAAFPVFSKLWADKKKEEFCKSFNSVFVQTMYIALPIGFLIFVLRQPIVATILQTGQFGTASTEITAACLGMYVISTFAQCLAPVLLRGFFSLKDTITPTAIALIFVVISYFFSIFFADLFQQNIYIANLVKSIFGLDGTVNFGVLGLVFGFNLTLPLEFLLLMVCFYRKIGDFGIRAIAISFFKMLTASLIMTICSMYVLYFVQSTVDPILMNIIHLPEIIYLLFDLCVTSSIAAMVYVFVTYVYGCKEVDFYKDCVLRKLRIRKKNED